MKTKTPLPSKTATATRLPTETSPPSPTVSPTAAAVILKATPPPGGKEKGEDIPLWQVGLIAVGAGLIVAIGGGRLGRWWQSRQGPVGPASVVVVEAEDGGGPVAAAEADDGRAELPERFFAEGVRILVVGPTRSGKSTILHWLLKRALKDESFNEIVLMDGKGPELQAYAQVPGVAYFGPEDLERWPEVLRGVSDELPVRYAALGGARIASDDAPRKLVVIDEVQRATRGEQGKEITEALLLIAEQSGALRDVLVLTTQRAKHRTLSKDITYNASLIVQTVGATSPGRYGVRTSIEQRKPLKVGQSQVVEDEDIAAWALQAAQSRDGRGESRD